MSFMDTAKNEASPKTPLVVAYGMGVDSTAVLVGLHQRGERPDLIMFADTGDEKPETYAYLPVINEWLARVGFPIVTVVKNARPVSGDKSLSESLIRNGQLPALAVGQHQCSIVWKIEPQQKFYRSWAPFIAARARGERIDVCVGYDAGARDSCRQYKSEGKDSEGCKNRFPLIEWGWDRARCEAEIAAAGLPVPVKSACFHCPASKAHEIVALKTTHPLLFARALLIESSAIPKAEARRALGKKAAKGLGRNFSWTERFGG